MSTMVKFSRKTSDGKNIYYAVNDDGFDIFIEPNLKFPLIHQYEPFILDPSKSYEENAKNMCEEFCKEVPKPDPIFTLTESEYNTLRCDLDYLMLLNDPDSAAETTE